MNEQFDEKTLKEIEKAAERGAKKGARKANLLSTIVPLVIIAVIAVVVISKVTGTMDLFKNAFGIGDAAEEHDLVLTDHGIFGYTAADFEDAILGDSKNLKKVEVYQQEISDVAELTNEGLFKLGAFQKVQCITYHGTATYTVDLSNLSLSDISVDNNQKLVTLRIPYPKEEEINIPEEKIEFGDVTKGLLAFGDITMTPEQSRDIQAGAREKMEQKLVECNAQETANRMAVLTIWEMYSPLIKGISSSYSLEVVLK